MKEIRRRGVKVRPWDPRNLGWWVWAVPSAVGLVMFGWAIAPGVVDYPVTLIVGLTLSVPLILLWTWVLRAPQIFTRISVGGSVAAATWGAGAATGLYALPANSGLITVVGQLAGIDVASSWGAAAVAPVVEETAKWLGIVAVLLASRAAMRNPMDGLVLGGMVGLGFTVAEDLLYGFNVTYLTFGENPLLSTALVYFVRTVLFGLVTHVLFTGIAGAGLGFLMSRPPVRRRAVGLGLVALAYALHFIWNSPWLLPLALRAVFILAVPAVMWLVLRLVRRAEYRWYRAAIQPEIDAGHVPERYALALAPTLRLRRRYRKSIVRAFGHVALAPQRRLEGLFADLADAADADDSGPAGGVTEGGAAVLGADPGAAQLRAEITRQLQLATPET